MSDPKDYHSFTSTSSGGGNGGDVGGGNGNGGCLSTFAWFFLILSFVMIASKFL